MSLQRLPHQRGDDSGGQPHGDDTDGPFDGEPAAEGVVQPDHLQAGNNQDQREVWLLWVRRLLVGHSVLNSAFHQQKQAMISGRAHTYWRPAVTSHSVQPLAERRGIPFFDDLILPNRGDYLA
jgi:hypothetical protein